MKIFISILLSFIFLTNSFAQKQIVNSEILPTDEIEKNFTTEVKKEFDIQFPIFRVYKYSDISGQYLTVLTESSDSIHKYKTIDRKDTFSYKIKAITIKINNGKLSKQWEINDFADRTKKGEQAIWFWTKYSTFTDINIDKLIDPIIVYGTVGKSNGFEDSRLQFVIYRKGQMITIRHLNGSDNTERKLVIDKTFYLLPVKIQNLVKSKMELMVKNLDAIFPLGWQKAMENKKTIVIEKP